MLAPARAKPERSIGFSIIGPESRPPSHIVGRPTRPDGEATSPEIIFLVGDEESVGGQVEDAGRPALGFEAASGAPRNRAQRPADVPTR